MTTTAVAVTANSKARCRFGRPHAWTYRSYDDNGTPLPPSAAFVQCANCGQVEAD